MGQGRSVEFAEIGLRGGALGSRALLTERD